MVGHVLSVCFLRQTLLKRVVLWLFGNAPILVGYDIENQRFLQGVRRCPRGTGDGGVTSGIYELRVRPLTARARRDGALFANEGGG